MNKSVVIRKATGHISIQATGLDALRILECIAAATNNIPMNARAVRGIAGISIVTGVEDFIVTPFEATAEV